MPWWNRIKELRQCLKVNLIPLVLNSLEKPAIDIHDLKVSQPQPSAAKWIGSRASSAGLAKLFGPKRYEYLSHNMSYVERACSQGTRLASIVDWRTARLSQLQPSGLEVSQALPSGSKASQTQPSSANIS